MIRKRGFKTLIRASTDVLRSTLPQTASGNKKYFVTLMFLLDGCNRFSVPETQN